MKERKKKAPIDCSFEELCRIERDNCDSGNFWCITDSTEVTFAEQEACQPPKQKISIPIRTFKRLLKFLATPQEIKGANK